MYSVVNHYSIVETGCYRRTVEPGVETAQDTHADSGC